MARMYTLNQSRCGRGSDLFSGSSILCAWPPTTCNWLPMPSTLACAGEPSAASGCAVELARISMQLGQRADQLVELVLDVVVRRRLLEETGTVGEDHGDEGTNHADQCDQVTEGKGHHNP